MAVAVLLGLIVIVVVATFVLRAHAGRSPARRTQGDRSNIHDGSSTSTGSDSGGYCTDSPGGGDGACGDSGGGGDGGGGGGD